jgi:addiction module RelB/DinJ family antitoxin
MNTAVINIKTDKQSKQELQHIAQEMGLSVSAVINGLIKQVIRTRSVTFSLDETDEKPTQYLLDALKESKEDIKSGRVVSFDNPQDALHYLDNLPEDDNEHIPHRLHQ